ncbi:hypothetical protein Tco_1484914 [Tanacetum coccineum]
MFHANGTCTWPAYPRIDSVGGRVQRLEEHQTVVRCPVATCNPWEKSIGGRAACLRRRSYSYRHSGLQVNSLLSMEQCSKEVGKMDLFEPVGCRRTARAAHAARAGRRVSAGGRTGNGSLGGLPQASNSQLRTEMVVEVAAAVWQVVMMMMMYGVDDRFSGDVDDGEGWRGSAGVA